LTPGVTSCVVSTGYVYSYIKRNVSNVKCERTYLKGVRARSSGRGRRRPRITPMSTKRSGRVGRCHQWWEAMSGVPINRIVTPSWLAGVGSKGERNQTWRRVGWPLSDLSQ